MTSKFKRLQKDVCEITSPTKEEMEKLCPTCIPDPNFIMGKWWESTEPFLNKKTCYYSTLVSINEAGMTFRPSTISKSGISFDDLLKTFIKPGVDFLFRHFNKDINLSFKGKPAHFYAEVEDYHFYNFADSNLVVLVSIPAAVFDRFPSLPEIPEIEPDSETTEIRIHADKFFLYMKTLKISLKAFSKFQGLHYHLERGKYFFEHSNKPFYLKFLPKRIEEFISKFEDLFEKNGFPPWDPLQSPLSRVYEIKLRFKKTTFSENDFSVPKLPSVGDLQQPSFPSVGDFPDIPGLKEMADLPEVPKIEFPEGPGLNPTKFPEPKFEITGIWCRKKRSKFKKLKVGWPSFKKAGPMKDPSLIYYISKIKKIDLNLRALKTPNWQDWVEQYTFPKIKMSYIPIELPKTGFKPFDNALGKFDDLIFEREISFSKIFEFKMNKGNKIKIGGLRENRETATEIVDTLKDGANRMGKWRNHLKLRTRSLLRRYLKKCREKDFSIENIKKALGELNPCKWKEIAMSAAHCLISNVSLETAYRAIIKSTFANLTAEGLEILLEGIPTDRRKIIAENVRNRIGEAPAPWEPEFEPGGDGVKGTIAVLTEQTGRDVFSAYEEAFIGNLTLEDIMKSLDNLPGSRFIGQFLAASDFPSNDFTYPPIPAFFESISLDPCGKFDLGHLSLPWPLKIPDWDLWDPFKHLSDLFEIGFKFTIKNLLIGILEKIAMLLPPDPPPPLFGDCRAANDDSKKASDYLTGKAEFGDLIGNLFGNEQPGENNKNNIADSMLKGSGISHNDEFKLPDNFGFEPIDLNDIPKLKTLPSEDRELGFFEEDEPAKTDPSYSNLTNVISVVTTKGELIRAIVSPYEDQDPNFLRNMANTLPSLAPEFANSLNTPEKIAEVFTRMGSFLTPEQQDALVNLEEGDEDYPLQDSICPTEEQKDEWDRERQAAFENAGLNPEMAKEFVKKQNERIKSDLEEVTDMVTRGPSGMIKDAINRSLGIPSEDEPECEDPRTIVNFEPPMIKEIFNSLSSGFFSRLEKAFIDDTIEWNLFERLWDTPGIISLILADKKGFTLNYHNTVNNSAILRFFLPDPGEDPETVSIHLKNFFDKQSLNLDDDYSILYNFSDELDDDEERFESEIKFYNYSNKAKYGYKVEITTKEETIKMKNEKSVLSGDLKFYSTQADSTDRNQQAMMFRKFINEKFSDIDGFLLNKKQSEGAYLGLNSIILEKLTKKLLTGKGGNIPAGFIYGVEDTEITKEDLKYVGPDGEDYNYEEEDSVLGKSGTSNPRVVFLDPNKFGGSYVRPKFYIKPVKQTGWKKLGLLFVPRQDASNSSPPSFLDTPQIVNKMDEIRNSIKADERLQQTPEELIRVPFDKVASPSDHSFMEGIVIATCRLFIADFMIKAMPVLSNVLISEKNYDDLVYDLIIENMEKNLSLERGLFKSPYDGFNYWLLFLEQAVQAIDRRIKSGEIDIDSVENSSLKQFAATLRDSQESLLPVYPEDLLKMKSIPTWSLRREKVILVAERQLELKCQQIVRGAAITAFGEGAINRINNQKEFFKFSFKKLNLTNASFAQKINTIHKTKKACKHFLKQIIKKEFELYKDKLVAATDPEPYITDITKFFIGSSQLSIKDSPTYGTNEAFSENISHCVKDPQTQNPLDGLSLSTSDYDFLIKRGGFFIEKYLRVVDKEGAPSNRDGSLSGVVNIEHFKKFLNSNKSLDKLKPVSDYFGDVKIVGKKQNDDKLATEALEGSIGIKFGVRVCFVPPENFDPATTYRKFPEKAMKEKSFIFKPATVTVMSEEVSSAFELATENADEAIAVLSVLYPPLGIALSAAGIGGDEFEKVIEMVKNHVPTKTLKSSKFIFPLCSYEQDVKDVNIGYYMESDSNFNQDVQCFLEQLCLQNDFKFIFERLFDVKRASSAIALYCYYNFLPALGVDSSERDKPSDDEPEMSPSELGKLFNDSKKELRKLFINNYKRAGFSPKDENDKSDTSNESRNNLMAQTLSNINFAKNIPWFSKVKKVTGNPLDLSGKIAKGNFASLFDFDLEDLE